MVGMTQMKETMASYVNSKGIELGIITGTCRIYNTKDTSSEISGQAVGVGNENFVLSCGLVTA